MDETTRKTILTALAGAFPSFPVTVQESPEDAQTILVRVFAVPTDMVRNVRDFIYDLEEKLSASGTPILMPMVKNLDATREHYPEHMPRPPISVGTLVPGRMTFARDVGMTAPLAALLKNALQRTTESVGADVDLESIMQTWKAMPAPSDSWCRYAHMAGQLEHSTWTCRDLFPNVRSQAPARHGAMPPAVTAGGDAELARAA